MNYMTQMLVSIVYVANLVITINRGTASAKAHHGGARLRQTSDRAPRVELAPGTSPLAWPSPSTTHRFTTTAHPACGGQRDAAAGRRVSLGIINSGTGSGKSSLVNLIPRLYDATSGEVRVFIATCESTPFTSYVSLSTVPQQASLVSGTIRSNLCWRDSNATDEELWRALELAQAADFVRGGTRLDAVVERQELLWRWRQRLTVRALVDTRASWCLMTPRRPGTYQQSLRQSLRSLRSELTCVIVSRVS